MIVHHLSTNRTWCPLPPRLKSHGNKIALTCRFFHVTLKSGEKRINRVVATEYFVDAQDVARLHSIRLLDESVQSEHLFGFATVYNWTDLLAILHKLRPNIQLPELPPNVARDLMELVPSKRAGGLNYDGENCSKWRHI